jgi:hypothetical protein
MAQAAEKIAVTMEDGRVVEFGQKQKMIKTSSIDGSYVETRFDFANGKSLLFIPSNANIKLVLMAHGAEQKIGDETAGVEEIDDCVLAVEAMIARLDKGEWSKERQKNGMAGTSVLIRALVESSGKPVEAVKAFLADKTQAQKLALRNNPKIKVIVDRLEAEKASKKPAAAAIDTDALLGELA